MGIPLGRFLRIIGAALALALLAAGPAAAVAADPGPLRILNDPGGEIGVRLRQVAHLRAQGRAVRIEGTCHSACTLYLGLEGACVTPAARLGFHGPRAAPRAVRAQATRGGQAGALGLSRAEADYWTGVMAAHYPEPLRSWFLIRMAEDPAPLRVLRGSQLIAAGLPACD